MASPVLTEKKRNKYVRILESALQVFAEKGFHRARISDVAKRAGVADGTVYLYFKNKHDLLIKTFEEIMEVILEKVMEILSSNLSPSDKMREIVRTHYELALTHPHIVEVITFELRQSHKFMKEYENRKFKEYLRLISEVIKEGQERGEFSREITPRVASRAIFGMLHETMLQWVAGGKKKDLDEISNTVLQMVIKAIRSH